MTWQMALVFGLGLVVGSFVNVVIYRLPHMIMAQTNCATPTERFDLCWPASHCPHCQARIKPWHNIPVLSFVWLKGRCIDCQQPIRSLYPAVEIATGMIWLTCAWHWGLSSQGLCWSIFATWLLALSIIDWHTSLLPDDLTQTLLWIGLGTSAAGWLPLELHHAVWGAIVGYTFLWTIATAFETITGKQGMGAGDFKLLAGLGAWLGPLALIPVMLLASICGASVGLYLKFTGRLNEDGYVPFGPFLAVAGWLVAVVGLNPMLMWIGW
jgi:leader peptidase (prepilin peptidase)/N-methyltransferase